MAIKHEEMEAVISDVESGNYTCYFFLPDFEKESGGVKLAYDHVKCMNENGFNAVVVHQKQGFLPAWLKDYYETEEDNDQALKNIPIVYLDDGNLPIRIQDFFFIPEGFPQVMENLAKQNAPCKKIIFCQNWYYILNALPPGLFWQSYGINDCMSVSKIQSDYIKMIMPSTNVKNVIGHIDDETFYPPEHMEDKKMQIAFIPSRDGGQKSYNVIKTFYAIFPHFRFMQFKELKGLPKDLYAESIRESAFYCHFDEASSWGTAPIEAYLSKTLVAGWDGVGGREYMNTDNTWIVPNGDIIRLAMAIGNMVETYIMDDISEKTWTEMEKAAMMYSKQEEKDSIVRVHNEFREERMVELQEIKERLKALEEMEEAKETEDA